MIIFKIVPHKIILNLPIFFVFNKKFSMYLFIDYKNSEIIDSINSFFTHDWNLHYVWNDNDYLLRWTKTTYYLGVNVINLWQNPIQNWPLLGIDLLFQLFWY